MAFRLSTAGLLLGAGLLCSLFLGVFAQLPVCDKQLLVLSNSCLADGNSSTVQARITTYFEQGCPSPANGSQGSVLELLVGAAVQLPIALLERFHADTGWTVRVTVWDEISGGLPPLAGSSKAGVSTSASSSGGGHRRYLTVSTAANSSTAAALEADWRQALALTYDAWILDSQLLAGLGRYGVLAPPAKLLDPASFTELQRASQPQIRLYGTPYQYRAAAVPLGSNALVLYCNGAALAKLYDDIQTRSRLGLGLSSSSSGSDGGGVALPLVWSWEQLIDAVAALNGTDFDGDGVVEHGMCLDVTPGCLAPALVQAVAASYMQTHGASGGVLQDPETMAWRVGTVGFRMALWTLQRLLAYSPRSGGGAAPVCRRLSAGFAEGRCAFSIHTLQHLKASYAWTGRDAGAVASTRVMLLPGSARVSPKASSSLVGCTSSTCPFAMPLSSGTDGGSGLLSSLGSAASWMATWVAGGTPSGGLTAVNVAPLVYGVPVGAVSAATPSPYGAMAAQLLAYLASSGVQEQLAADLGSGVLPFRRMNLSNLLAVSASATAQPPQPSQQQLQELTALQAQLWGHPNAAPAFRTPGAELTWPLFDAAVAQLQASDPFATSGPNLQFADDDLRAPQPEPSPAVAAAVAALAAALPATMASYMQDEAAEKAEYRASLLYRQPVLSVHIEVHEGIPRARRMLVVGLAVGLSVGVLALAIASAVYARQSLRALRRTASQGDDSSNQHSTATYVVLDIQGLSDGCTADAAREQALRQCHDVIKQLARRYDGALVSLPETEQQHAKRRWPTPSAALQAAVRAELAAAVERSADGRPCGAAVWGPDVPDARGAGDAAGPALAMGMSMDVGKAMHTGGCADGEAGAGGADGVGAMHYRPGFWTYDSEYLSLTSRDLEAVPSLAHAAAGFALGTKPDVNAAGSALLPPPPGAFLTAPRDLIPGTGEAVPAAEGGSKNQPGTNNPVAPAGPSNGPPTGAVGTSSRAPDVAGHVSPQGSPQRWGRRGGGGVPTTAVPTAPLATPLGDGGGGGEPTATTTSSTLAMTYSGGRVISKSGGGVTQLEEDGSVRRPMQRSVSDATRLPLPTANSSGAVGAGVQRQRLLSDKAVAVAPLPASRVGVQMPSPGVPSPALCTRNSAERTSGSPVTDRPLEEAASAPAPGGSGVADPEALHATFGRPSHNDQAQACGPPERLLQPPPSLHAPQLHHPRQQQASPKVATGLARTESPEAAYLYHELDCVAGPHTGLLPTLPEGTVAGLSDSHALWNHGGLLHTAPGRSGMSLLAGPLAGREYCISSPRLVPTVSGPNSAAAVTSPGASSPPQVPPAPPPTARTGVLAAAMAAAKAATMAAGAGPASPAPPLPTRVALMFASVYDAVCFCVHMQASLTSVRWPAEVLQLPDCRQIAVRARSAGEGEQQTSELGGAAKDRTASGRPQRADGSKAGSIASGAVGIHPDQSGNTVMTSSQSASVMNSNSPFTAAGAVDRMKSLIAGGVKGRSGRALRQHSPRVGTVLTVAGPDRPGVSVSRFASTGAPVTVVSNGAGDAPAPPLLNAPTFGAGMGAGLASNLDPWVGGINAAAAAASSAGSREGSVSTWCPPPFAGLPLPPAAATAVPGDVSSGSASLSTRASVFGDMLSRGITPPRSPLGSSHNLILGSNPGTTASSGAGPLLRHASGNYQLRTGTVGTSASVSPEGPGALLPPRGLTWRGGATGTSASGTAFLDSATNVAEVQMARTGGAGGSAGPGRFAGMSSAAVVAVAAAAAAAAGADHGSHPAGPPSASGHASRQGSGRGLLETAVGSMDMDPVGDDPRTGSAADRPAGRLTLKAPSGHLATPSRLAGTAVPPVVFRVSETLPYAGRERRSSVGSQDVLRRSISRAHAAGAVVGDALPAAPVSAGSDRSGQGSCAQVTVTQLPMVSVQQLAAQAPVQGQGSGSLACDSSGMVGSAITLIVPGSGAAAGQQPHLQLFGVNAMPTSVVVIGDESDRTPRAGAASGVSEELPQHGGSFIIGGESALRPQWSAAYLPPGPVAEGLELGPADDGDVGTDTDGERASLGPIAAAARSSNSRPLHALQLARQASGMAAAQPVADVAAPVAAYPADGAGAQLCVGVQEEQERQPGLHGAALHADDITLKTTMGSSWTGVPPPGRQESHLTVSSLGNQAPSPLPSPFATGFHFGPPAPPSPPASHPTHSQPSQPSASRGSHMSSNSWLQRLHAARRGMQNGGAGSGLDSGSTAGGQLGEGQMYGTHRSMPMNVIHAEEHGGGHGSTLVSAFSGNLCKLPPLRAAGAPRRDGDWLAGYTTADAGGGRGNSSGACVRSFGEQVRMTFETLDAADARAGEGNVIVIFRGPRVVCGISTWQYGDDDPSATQQEALPLQQEIGCLADGTDARGTELESDDVPKAHARGAVDAEALILKQQHQPQHHETSASGERVTGTSDNEFSVTHSNPLYSAPFPRVSRHRLPATAEIETCPSQFGHSSQLQTLPNSVAAPGSTSQTALASPAAGAATAAATLLPQHPRASGELTSDNGLQLVSTQPSPIGALANAFAAAGAASALEAKRLQRRRLPAALRRALAICECGQGGFVLLDGASYSATSQEVLQERCMILHMGDYALTDPADPPADLYLALAFDHLARLAHLRPLAACQQLSLGLLSAPVNAASICFTLVSGMQALLAWNSDVAKSALGALRGAVLPALLRHGGYLVEDVDGLLLTAFPSSRSALAWALECQAEAKHLDWPEELLGHALGEAVYLEGEEEEATGELEETGVSTAANAQRPNAGGPSPPSPRGLRSALRRQLMFRGLRFKCGMDCGDVLARVHTTTGRMTYRGRVMNRAARIAGMAGPGQVLCSRGLWDASGLEAAPDLCERALAVGESMGEMQLKGLAAKMEIINCVRILREDLVSMATGSALELPLINPARFGAPAYADASSDVDADTADEANGSGMRGGASIGGADAPILMQAVPMLGDSDEDQDTDGIVIGSPEDGRDVGNEHDETSGSFRHPDAGIGAAAAAAAAPEGVTAGEHDVRAPGREKPSAAAETDGRPPGGAAATPASVSVPPRLGPSMRSATARYAYGRSSVASVARSSFAAAGAASAEKANGPVTRVRRVSLLQNSRFVHSGGLPLDRTGGGVAAVAAAALGNVAGARSTASGAVLAAAAAALLSSPDEEDDIADRLVAGYSSDEEDSEGSVVGTGVVVVGGGGGDLRASGGSLHIPERPSATGVAALHGMLRRQRAVSSMGVVPHGAANHAGGGGGGTASGSGAAPTHSAGGLPATAGGAGAVGTLATAAAANFKRALRAVRRSILDDPNAAASHAGGRGGSESGDDHPSLERWQPVRPGGGAGGESDVSEEHRVPRRAGGSLVGSGGPKHRRRQIEAPKAAHQSTPPATPEHAAAPAGRLFARLRSLAPGRAREKARGGSSTALDELDYDGMPLRPMASANSEVLASRGGSSLPSALRLGSRVGMRGGSAAAATPLSGDSSTAARSPQLHTNSVGGTGGGALNRSNSRNAGHCLVAEMSLASMTMRRHIPVSELLGAAAAGGAAHARSFRRNFSRGGGSGGSADDEAGLLRGKHLAGMGLVGRRGSGSAAAAAAAAPSPTVTQGQGQQQPPQSPIMSRHRSQDSVQQRLSAYGIQEDEGEEDSGNSEGTRGTSSRGASGAVSHHQRDSRPSTSPGLVTRKATAAASGAGGAQASPSPGPRLPAKLLSFTSSFLHRQKPKPQQPAQQQAAQQPPQQQPQQQVLQVVSHSLMDAHLLRTGSSEFIDLRGSGGTAGHTGGGTYYELVSSGGAGGGVGSAFSPPQAMPRQLSRMGSSRRGSTVEVGANAAPGAESGSRPADGLTSNSFTATRAHAPQPAMRHRPSTGPGIVPDAPILADGHSAAAAAAQQHLLQSLLPPPPHLRQRSGQRATPQAAGAAGGAGHGAAVSAPSNAAFRSPAAGYGSRAGPRHADLRRGSAGAGPHPSSPGGGHATGSLVDPLGSDASASAPGVTTGWTGHLFNSIHSLLGLAPQGGGSGAAHGLVSPRTSVILGAPNSSASVTCVGTTAAPCGAGGVTGSRQGSRRREDAGAECASVGGGSAARTHRRRSVIEISGNTLTLNAGSSYAAGGWQLDLDGDVPDLVPKMHSAHEPPAGSASGTPHGSLFGSADGTTRHSPRRRRSQRMLTPSAGGGGGSRARVESTERRRSLLRQVSVTRSLALSRSATGGGASSALNTASQQPSHAQQRDTSRGRGSRASGGGAADDSNAVSIGSDSASAPGIARFVRGVSGFLSRSQSANNRDRGQGGSVPISGVAQGLGPGPSPGMRRIGSSDRRGASHGPGRAAGPSSPSVYAGTPAPRGSQGGAATAEAAQPQPPAIGLSVRAQARASSSDAKGMQFPFPGPKAVAPPPPLSLGKEVAESAAATEVRSAATLAAAVPAEGAYPAGSPRADRPGSLGRRLIPDIARSARGLIGMVRGPGNGPTSGVKDRSGHGGHAFEGRPSLDRGPSGTGQTGGGAGGAGTGGLWKRARHSKSVKHTSDAEQGWHEQADGVVEGEEAA